MYSTGCMHVLNMIELGSIVWNNRKECTCSLAKRWGLFNTVCSLTWITFSSWLKWTPGVMSTDKPVWSIQNLILVDMKFKLHRTMICHAPLITSNLNSLFFRVLCIISRSPLKGCMSDSSMFSWTEVHFWGCFWKG